MIWSLIWFWLLGIFTTADIVLSRILMTSGFYEGNPLGVALITHSPELIIPIKLSVTIVMVLMVERLSKGNGWVPVSLAASESFAAVVWNVGKIGGVI